MSIVIELIRVYNNETIMIVSNEGKSEVVPLDEKWCEIFDRLFDEVEDKIE